MPVVEALAKDLGKFDSQSVGAPKAVLELFRDGFVDLRERIP